MTLRNWTIKKMLECLNDYEVTNHVYTTSYAFSHITNCKELEDVDAISWFDINYKEICDYMKDFCSPYNPTTRPIEFMECFYKEYACDIFREVTSELPHRIVITKEIKDTIIKSLLALEKK